MSDRRPKRSPITVRTNPDGTYTIVVTGDVTLAELRKFHADLAWLLAGAE